MLRASCRSIDAWTLEVRSTTMPVHARTEVATSGAIADEAEAAKAPTRGPATGAAS